MFDSGLGGLSVVSQVRKALPDADIIYFADNAHVPYGERSADEVKSFAIAITDFLIEKGADAVVMACNMSSAIALETTINLYPDTPILGMINSGARAALDTNGESPIGILATSGTVKSKAYITEIRKITPNCQVFQQACPKFVPIVESGISENDEAEEAARIYIESLINAKCKTIILGCTHYPFLINIIKSAAGPGISIIDPAIQLAEDIKATITNNRVSNRTAKSIYYTSGSSAEFKKLGEIFLHSEIDDVQEVKWGVDIHLPFVKN